MKYASEASMCAEIVEWARKGGCKVFPETSGWDMILVAPDGTQIGIQAKLKPGYHVVAQCLEGMRGNTGPDVVAVLIPGYDVALDRVIEALGITLMPAVGLAPRGYSTFEQWLRGARRRLTTQRAWVPEVEVELPCGVPAPRTLSPWKFGAAKLCARLRAGEHLTRKDFAEHGINVSAWVQWAWIERVGETKPARYTHRERFKLLPDHGFPEIVAALGLPLPVDELDRKC